MKKSDSKRKPKSKNEHNYLGEFMKQVMNGFLIGLLKGIYENFLETVKENFYEVQEKVMKDIKEYTYEAQNRLIGMLTSFAFMIVGGTLLLVSIIFLIKEYTHLSWGWSFFIIGIILLTISLMIRGYTEIKHNKKE